jgi:hypothetical protein
MRVVYLIKDEVVELYKIGVAKNPVRRLQKLQTGNPHKLSIVCTYEAMYPFRLETLLHNKFKNQCVLNEWYELTDVQVERFIQTCEEQNEIINALETNPFFNKNLK